MASVKWDIAILPYKLKVHSLSQHPETLMTGNFVLTALVTNDIVKKI